jgi:hypothetical protein
VGAKYGGRQEGAGFSSMCIILFLHGVISFPKLHNVKEALLLLLYDNSFLSYKKHVLRPAFIIDVVIISTKKENSWSP